MSKKPTKTKVRKTRVTATKKKSAPSKAAASTKPVPSKPVPVKPIQPSVIKAATPVVNGPILKKKDLITDVVARSGMKKKDVKPVVEATLAALGAALAEDRELNLPPFAKMKIQRVKDVKGARITVARLRQKNPDKDAAE